MNYFTDEKFSFESKAVDKGTFGVVSFTGSEGLSQLYQFDITLIADKPDLDLAAILEQTASIFIHRPDGSKVPFHGIIAECELVQQVGSHYLYRVLLVPKLWRLTLTHHNQIFLNCQPMDIISQVLKDGGLTALDFEFRLMAGYVTWEYACQYGESHFSFVCRWMERNGIYFFFDQSGETEKLIMTDSKIAHVASQFGNDLTYAPVSGLEAMHLDESVQSFICRRQLIPKTVTLQDYNYRKPTLAVKGKAEITTKGHGELYYYGDHFRTPEEGDKLAKIRSEEFLCKEKQFHGQSTVPYLMPGYTFTVASHFNSAMNRGYLTISQEHKGNQAAYLISGIRENLTGIELESVYQNTFTAIEDDVQFRAQRLTERPRLHGTLSGRIDAVGSGQYAEVDDQGRYKVILPFDRSGRSGGNASAWVRMMQPYVGSDHGMHFPLHKGCDVLLTFIDGDPDRPVIAGAVANPETPSQITSDNQTMAKLTTSGGNKMHIEDREGQQRIVHQSPTANTWMRMGAPNDPPDGDGADADADGGGGGGEAGEENEPWYKPNAEQKPVETKEDGFGFSTAGSANWWVGINYKVEIGGFSNTLVIGGENKQVIGEEYIGVLGGSFHVYFPWDVHISPAHSKMHTEIHKIHGMETTIAANSTSINTNRTNIHGQLIRVADSEEAIIAERNRITVNENNIATERNRITANENNIATERNRITANENNIATERNRITANENNIATNSTNITGNRTSIDENSTNIATQRTQINTVYDVLAGDVMLI